MKILQSKFVGCRERSAQRKIYGIDTYIKKEKRCKINYLSFYLRKLGEEQIISPKQTEEIIKIRAIINETENRK